MSDKITLFQNDRNWKAISRQVIDLIDREHTIGMAQNSPLVRRLEETLAEKYNRKHCITVASCTDALVIGMQLLNLPAGSPVAVSNYTFTATPHAVARAGYSVVPVDVNDNYCINTKLINNVCAIVNVDLFGNMADWNKLNSLGIPVVNDAAQSLESNNGTVWSAECGLISCVSFSPSKTISSWGSGGAILTNNDEYADLARRLRLHGKLNNDDTAIATGMNSMISTFEAACVYVGLQHSNKWLQRRREIAKYLINESVYKTGIDFNLAQHTLHKLVFKADNRSKVLEQFKLANIDCSVHYKLTVNDEPLYKTSGRYTKSNQLKKVSFTVPNQHTLTDEEVERIARVLK